MLFEGELVQSKECTSCKQLQRIEDFVRNKNFQDGRNHICKACLYARRRAYGDTPTGRAIINAGMNRRYRRDIEARRNDKIERQHGVPRNTRAVLLELQGGVCAICGQNREVGGRRLAIDHDHKTKAIRGMLCTWCNQALGQLGEDPKLLRKAADYLENPPAEHLSLTSVFRRKSEK